MSSALLTYSLQLACRLLIQESSSHGSDTIASEDGTFHPIRIMALPGGYTVFPDLGVAYKYHLHPLTWESARQLCISEGASLSTVDSYKKIDYIMGIKDPHQGTWTSYRKATNNDPWINNVTGQPAQFIPWRPDAASNTGLCIANRHDTLGVSAWNCNNLVPVVCELPIFKNEKNKVYLLAEPTAQNSIISP